MTLLKLKFFLLLKDTIIATPIRVIEGVEDRENREARESLAPLDK
jgi:hypothetical protein